MTFKKYIPNSITSMNLVCGIIGVIFAFKGRLELSFILMLAAAVFDFLDGTAARLLNAYSELGKELDSLCDLVSFGVLPSVMMYSLMTSCMFGENWACWIPLAFTVFAGFRLAKFNVDTRQTDSFLGLPVPSAAVVCGSLCCFICHSPGSVLGLWAAGPVFVPALSLVLGFLMVSEIPMFSIKFHKGDPIVLQRKRLALAVLAVLVVAVCIVYKLNWSLAVLVIFLCYILKNILYAIARV